MSVIRDLYDRIFGEGNNANVPIGGTLATPTGNERYPIAIGQQVLGHPKYFEDLDEMADCPIAWLVPTNQATVAEHVDGGGVLRPQTVYLLTTLPEGVDKISDIPDYNLSDYWKVFKAQGDFATAAESQYAPNVDGVTGAADNNGGQPIFPGKNGSRLITQAEYEALIEDETVVLESAGPDLEGYWADEFDATKNHVWMRQRSGINSKWGIPVKVSGESYESGDYISNMFKWSATKPLTPAQYVDGVSNDAPATWTDSPPANPGGGLKLWMIQSQKDVYGRLKTPWQMPIEVIQNALLTRYSETATPNPNDIDYADLTSEGWIDVLDPTIHKYIATRQDLGDDEYTSWVVQQIFRESGEYDDYVFKLFQISERADILSDPDAYRPSGQTPSGWSDQPLQAASDEVVFMSAATKFFNGEIKTNWSDPIPFSGVDTILPVISSTPGDDFKTDPNVDPAVTVPTEIELTANLYKGVDLLSTGVTYQWTKIYDDGDLLDPAEDYGTTKEITIEPADVTGKAVFRCVMTFDTATYTTEISILDITDGIDAKSLVLTGNTNIVMQKIDLSRLPASLVLRAIGSNLSDDPDYTWFYLDEDDEEVDLEHTGDSYTVDYTLFNTQTEITFRVKSVDGLYDDWTVYQIPEATDGDPISVMVLSNENVTVVENEATGVISFTNAFTNIKVFEGGTDVTSLWTITKASTGCTSTQTGGTSTPKVTVTALTAGLTQASVTITATRTSYPTLTRKFNISKIVDRIGSIIVDIDSDNNGFVFTPSIITDKVLTAKLYVNGAYTTTGVTYVWTRDGTAAGTSQTCTVTAAQVDFKATMKVVATYNGVAYTRVVDVTDVPDSKGLGIMYVSVLSTTTLGTNDRPLDATAYNASSGGSISGPSTYTWSTTVPAVAADYSIWMTTRKEGASAWALPIRITGEKGTQGSAGNYFRNVFRKTATGVTPLTPTGNYASGTSPVSNSTPTGSSVVWTDNPPTLTPGAGEQLWVSWGQLTTANVLVGAWTAPVKINGTDGAAGVGTNGTNGTNGLDGNPYSDAGSTDINTLKTNGIYKVSVMASNGPGGTIASSTYKWIITVEGNGTDSVKQTAMLVDAASIADTSAGPTHLPLGAMFTRVYGRKRNIAASGAITSTTWSAWVRHEDFPTATVDDDQVDLALYGSPTADKTYPRMAVVNNTGRSVMVMVTAQCYVYADSGANDKSTFGIWHSTSASGGTSVQSKSVKVEVRNQTHVMVTTYERLYPGQTRYFFLKGESDAVGNLNHYSTYADIHAIMF